MDISFIPDVYAATSILDPNGSYGIRDIIRIGIALVVLIAGFCAVIFVIWGGLMLILSGGKDEKVKPAINSIRYAVLGIIIIIVSIFILPKAGDALGIPIGDYLSPKNVFETVKILTNRIVGTSDSTYSTSASNMDISF
jgi:hypothetical protein